MSRYRVIEFAELDSTNRHACSRLHEMADRDVIQAGIQTAGRGRWERKWISDVPGNLCLSLVLKPSGAPASLPLANLSQLLAVSACRVLAAQGVQPTVKWPNDIQVGGCKIGGILAETVVSGSKFQGLVLGIGVNLNMSRARLELIGQPATALNICIGRDVNAGDFRDALLQDFFASYDAFLSRGFPMIRDEYRRRCPFLGCEVEIRSLHETFRGIACDISETGELELESPPGRRRRIALGEISVRA